MKLRTEIIQLSSIEVLTLTDELDILINHETHVMSLFHGPSVKLIPLRLLEASTFLKLVRAVGENSEVKLALLQEKLFGEGDED